MYGRGHHSPGLGFGPPVTPPIIKQLLIANAAVFVVQMLFANRLVETPYAVMPMIEYFGSVTPMLFWEKGYLWQPFTYMWLHGGFGHIAMNCFALWMFGSPLALLWGPKRFLRYYLLCGVGAGFIIATFRSSSDRCRPSAKEPPEPDTRRFGSSVRRAPRLLAHVARPHDHADLPARGLPGDLADPDPLRHHAHERPRRNVSHVGHVGGVIVGWLYLRRSGTLGSASTLDHLKYRWRRYRMRQKLRSVHEEDFRTPARARSRRRDDAPATERARWRRRKHPRSGSSCGVTFEEPTRRPRPNGPRAASATSCAACWRACRGASGRARRSCCASPSPDQGLPAAQRKRQDARDRRGSRRHRRSRPEERPRRERGGGRPAALRNPHPLGGDRGHPRAGSGDPAQVEPTRQHRSRAARAPQDGDPHHLRQRQGLPAGAASWRPCPLEQWLYPPERHRRRHRHHHRQREGLLQLYVRQAGGPLEQRQDRTRRSQRCARRHHVERADPRDPQRPRPRRRHAGDQQRSHRPPAAREPRRRSRHPRRQWCDPQRTRPGQRSPRGQWPPARSPGAPANVPSSCARRTAPSACARARPALLADAAAQLDAVVDEDDP